MDYEIITVAMYIFIYLAATIMLSRAYVEEK